MICQLDPCQVHHLVIKIIYLKNKKDYEISAQQSIPNKQFPSKSITHGIIKPFFDYPPKSESKKLPLIIKKIEDNRLARKMQIGTRKGELLMFNQIDDDPTEVKHFNLVIISPHCIL